MILTGCAKFYTFNLFDGLDPVTIPDIPTAASDTKPAETLSSLQTSMDSASFINALKDSSQKDKLTAIDTYLKDIYSGDNPNVSGSLNRLRTLARKRLR